MEVVSSVQDLHSEGVLLVTAHVRVAHEVEDVFVGTWSRCREIQFHFRLWLQGHSLDRSKARKVKRSIKKSSKRIIQWFFYLLLFGSPITTHHPSSRFWRGKGLINGSRKRGEWVSWPEGKREQWLEAKSPLHPLSPTLLPQPPVHLWNHREREGEKKREGQLMRG